MNVCLYAALVLASLVSRTAGDSCATHSNGCSIPFGWTFFYKSLFTHACDKHDVCYSCGADHGLTKDACDNAFLRDMKSACAANSRRELTTTKRSVCTTTATGVYYEAVHHFGSSHFSNAGSTDSYCAQSWVRSCLP